MHSRSPAGKYSSMSACAPRGWLRFSAVRTALTLPYAVACATNRRNELRCRAVYRRPGSSHRWLPVLRSVCSNRHVFLLSRPQDPAPLTSGARAVHKTLTLRRTMQLGAATTHNDRVHFSVDPALLRFPRLSAGAFLHCPRRLRHPNINHAHASVSDTPIRAAIKFPRERAPARRQTPTPHEPKPPTTGNTPAPARGERPASGT